MTNKWSTSELNNDFNLRQDIETPDPQLIYPSEVKTEWKRSFVVVTFPFLFIGFPLNLLVWESDESSVKYRIFSTTSWFVYFFKPYRGSVILTIIFFIFSMVPYYIIVQAIYYIIYDLLYIAILNWDILWNTLNLLRYLPLAIPLVMAWLWGYAFKNLIRSFDSVRAEFHDRLNYSWRIPPTFQSPFQQVWCKLLIIYFLIVASQIVIILIVHYVDSDSFSSGIYWIGFTIQLIYNLVFPVYAMCCWALESELTLLSLYLRSLVLDNLRPTFRIFNEIKDLYKKIAKQVYIVNRAFGLYMSFVIIVTLSNAYTCVGYAGALFSPYFVMLFTSSLQSLGLDLGPTVSPDENFSTEGPKMLRTVVGYMFVALLQSLLVLITVKQAIKVNSSARFIHVLLNDFVTHSTATIMTPELYQSYRLLKFYIHSTMEQIEKPVLLRIAILNFLPYFGRRLHTYNLRF